MALKDWKLVTKRQDRLYFVNLEKKIALNIEKIGSMWQLDGFMLQNRNRPYNTSKLIKFGGLKGGERFKNKTGALRKAKQIMRRN